LSDVINKILDAGDQGAFDVMDKPSCESREGASRYNVNITNATYLSLLNEYSVNSPRISLRRLIYWFVENEMYIELDWPMSNEYVDDFKTKFNKKLTDAINTFQSFKILAQSVYKNEVLLETIEDCYEELKEKYKE
jgi:predicted DNA-binding protein (UPF0278 family)